MDDSTRREVLFAGGAALLAVTLRPAEATPAMLASAIPAAVMPGLTTLTRMFAGPRHSFARMSAACCSAAFCDA